MITRRTALGGLVGVATFAGLPKIGMGCTQPHIRHYYFDYHPDYCLKVLHYHKEDKEFIWCNSLDLYNKHLITGYSEILKSKPYDRANIFGNGRFVWSFFHSNCGKHKAVHCNAIERFKDGVWTPELNLVKYSYGRKFACVTEKRMFNYYNQTEYLL